MTKTSKPFSERFSLFKKVLKGKLTVLTLSYQFKAYRSHFSKAKQIERFDVLHRYSNGMRGVVSQKDFDFCPEFPFLSLKNSQLSREHNEKNIRKV